MKTQRFPVVTSFPTNKRRDFSSLLKCNYRLARERKGEKKEGGGGERRRGKKKRRGERTEEKMPAEETLNARGKSDL